MRRLSRFSPSSSFSDSAGRPGNCSKLNSDRKEREREREREREGGASVQVQRKYEGMKAVGNLTEEEAACINGIEPIERKGGGRRGGRGKKPQGH